MAKPFLCRLGIAQISVNPAYADELVSWIHEPAFPEESEKVGLFTIGGIDEVNRLRLSIAEQYIEHLNRKVEAIVRFAANDGVELLVFPEYSIPPETLPVSQRLADELGLVVIAGSHVFTLSQTAQQVYHDLDFSFATEKPPEVEEKVRQAISVVILPNKKPIPFTKYVRSKWESCLISGTLLFTRFRWQPRPGK